MFTDKRYYYSAVNLAKAKCFLIDKNSLKNFIECNKVNRVGLIYSLTNVEFYNEVISLNVKVYDCSCEVFLKTAIKSQNEIKLIQQSCSVLEKSLIDAISQLRIGITESEVAGIIEYNFKKNGAEKPSFDTIVAFGEGTAIPHYKTSNNVLKSNVPVLIDCGCYYKGYASDITRSFYFGIPNKEYESVFSAVYNAHVKAFNEITANMTCKDADGIARRYLEGLGYGDYFTHSLGHGVGVKIHESPRLSKNSLDILENGNVFSIEPGVYIDGKFGVRIEDTVYLQNDKCKSFFKLNKNVKGYIPNVK